MSSSPIDESGLLSLGTEVAVSDIDRELHRFFAGEEDGGATPERNSPGLARASLLNLAIYAEESNSSVGRLSKTIEELTREMACRAILILAEAGGAPSVRSWVQAHCRLSGQGQKTVCTEQVSFLLSGANGNLVRNTVFAHLDSDLPLVFWWRGEFSDVFDERLYSRIDRFLFDSAAWARPANQFLRLSRALEDSEGGFVAHDLAYTRSHPARNAIARVFDDPSALESLDQLESIEVAYAPGQRLSALWLAAWVGQRLRADLEGRDAGSGHFRFTWSGRRLVISCRENSSADAPTLPDGKAGEAILEVGLHLGTRGDIEIRHDAECRFWRLRWLMADGTEREKLFPGVPRSDADLAAEVLKRAGRNRAMTEALSLMRELVVA